jgi:chromosome segregation ATPase
MDTQNIIAIVGALAGLLVAIGTWRKAAKVGEEIAAAQTAADAAQLTADAAAHKATVTNLIETVEAQAKEIARLRACIEDLEGDRDRDREKIDKLEEALVAVRQELAQAEAENRSLRAENVQWKARVRALEGEIAQMRNRFGEAPYQRGTP